MKLNQFNTRLSIVASVLVLGVMITSMAIGQTTWTGASGDHSWFTAGNWDTGVVPVGSTFDAIVNSPAPTEISTGTVNLNSLVVGPDGMIMVSHDLNFSGTAGTTLTNQGVISKTGAFEMQLVRDAINGNLIIADASRLDVAGVDGATLGGGGTVRLQFGGQIAAGSPNPTLTVDDQRIEGDGTIWHTIGLIVESGNTIDADVAGETLSIITQNNPLVNAGTFQASNTGTMLITGATGGVNQMDNTLGTIQALAGSDVEFRAITVDGGSLFTQGDGVLRVSSQGASIFQDVIIDGNFRIDNGSLNARFAGAIENRQTITMNSTGSNVEFDIPDGQTTTLSGGGTIQMIQSAATGQASIGRDIGVAGATALILDDQTIEGEGLIRNDLVMINTAGNLIDANVDGDVLEIITGGSGIGLDGHVNRGTMQASAGGILQLRGYLPSNPTDFDNNGGLIRALAGSEVRLDFLDIFGGTLATSGDGFLLGGHGLRLFDLVIDGDLRLGSGNTYFQGAIENRQNIMTNNGGPLYINSPGVTLTGGGTITLADNSYIATFGDVSPLTITDQTIQGFGDIGGPEMNFQEDSLIDANILGETLTITPARIGIWGPVEFFENTGTLCASNGGMLEIIDFHSGATASRIVNEGIIDARSGSTVQVTRLGTASGGGLISSISSTLTGSGAIAVVDPGQSIISVSGRIEPGDSIGILTLGLTGSDAGHSPNNGTISLNGQLEIEIGGTGAGTGHDQLILINTHVNKFTTIGGDLEIRLVGGFLPGPADEFVIVSSADGYTGTFSSGNMVAFHGGTFDINYNAANVTLTNFQPTPPEPATTADVVQGILVSGTVADLLESDNVDMAFIRNPGQIASVVEVEVETTTTEFNPTYFEFTVEASAFFRSQVMESVEFFDYDAGEFVQIDSWPASRFVDGVATVSGTGDLARFVDDATGNVKARVAFTSAVGRQKFSAAIDQVFWLIN